MINFDARSFLLTSLVVGILCTIVFAALRRSFPKEIGGISDWAAGDAVFVSGALLFVLRDLLPAALGVVIANTLVTGGILLMYSSLRKFAGMAPRYGIALAILGVMFAGLCLVVRSGQPVEGRLLLVTAINTTIFLASARVILRMAVKGFPEWFTASIFILIGVSSLTRFAASMLHYDLPENAMNFSAVQQIYLATYSIAIMSANFGFLLMVTRKLSMRLEHTAARDHLTGAFTRAAFTEVFDKEIGRSNRHVLPLALLIVDIDDFKQVNDRHGHPMGDEVIKAFANLATQELRDQDALCRYGGEEFAILLPDTGAAEALVVAERIRKTFGACHLPGLPPATVSIGLMASNDGRATMDTLIGQADRALYLAKNSGKNRVVVSPEMGDSLLVLEPAALRR
jgi:diguanylate cyclase (GGDEF)-like protein